MVAGGLHGAIERVGGTIDNERRRTVVDTERFICRDNGVRNNNARNEGANIWNNLEQKIG